MEKEDLDNFLIEDKESTDKEDFDDFLVEDKEDTDDFLDEDTDEDDINDFLDDNEICSETSEEEEINFFDTVIKVDKYYEGEVDPNKNLIDESIIEEICKIDDLDNLEKICTNNYSIVSEYPINFEEYDLCEDIKFEEKKLSPGTYAIIPKNYMLWIMSEPQTYYIRSEIKLKEVKNEDFILGLDADCVVIKTNLNQQKIETEKLKISLQNKRCNILCSDEKDVSPVHKPYGSMFKRKLENVLLKDGLKYIKKKKREYVNIEIEEHDIINLNDKKFEIFRKDYDFDYKSKLCFNLNKGTQNGLEYNENIRIIHVLSGEITILVADEKWKEYSYITYLPYARIKKKYS